MDRKTVKRALVAFAVIGFFGVLLLPIFPLGSLVAIVLAELLFLVLYLRIGKR